MPDLPQSSASRRPSALQTEPEEQPDSKPEADKTADRPDLKKGAHGAAAVLTGARDRDDEKRKAEPSRQSKENAGQQSEEDLEEVSHPARR
jgi:hypothetical protein